MATRGARRRLLRALPGLALLAASCELLVDGDLGTVLCAEEGTVGPPACPDGFACRGGACIDAELTRRDLGRACANDADCAANDLCFDPKRFGGGGDPVCARTCCTSSDCDPSGAFVCWTPDRGGGGFCRRGDEIGRSQVGARLAGERCGGGGDCRSGICHDGACVDACCSDTNCAAGGASCQLTTGILSVGSAWACRRVPPGKAGYFARCQIDEDCASGLCALLDGVGRCTIPCCSSDTCPVSFPDGTVFKVGCTEVMTSDNSVVKACSTDGPERGSAAVGAPCVEGSDCRGGMCVPGEASERVCSDVCCTEASCGDVSLFGCRPYDRGPSWALRCAPK